MEFPPGCAFMDGTFIPMSEAKISVLDWGFLRSDATYDVVHVWKGNFFRLEDHLDRFENSMRIIRLDPGYARDEIRRILAECVQRSGLEDAYVEMICTRGMSPTFDRDPRKADNRFIAFAIPFGWILKPEQRERGMNIAIASIERIAPESVNPTVKNYHWLDLVMGLYEAYDRDAENVVLIDGAGNVTEGPGFNLFVIRNGNVLTPERGVLHGISRQTAIDLLRERQIPAETGLMPIEAVTSADEIFATSTAGGILPVTTLNGKKVGNGGPGPITTQLIEDYWNAHSRADWNSPVEALLNAETGVKSAV